MAGSDFRGSNLAGAYFEEARMRNVDFAEANLLSADFTDADWFNALGLTEGQLTQVRREYIAALSRGRTSDAPLPGAIITFCPSDRGHHVSQEQLKATWSEYLQPGGLRDIVAELAANSSPAARSFA